ncbi:MAG: YtxH domain-containing protein [Actinobacteria bacterium]|nr:YtxH domain-containing protein [Actinomycetota bacterium]
MKSSNAFGCTLLIFGLGVLAGILIAPRKGEETRKILREQMEECCGKTCEFITEKAAQVKKQAQKYAEELKKGMEETE